MATACRNHPDRQAHAHGLCTSCYSRDPVIAKTKKDYLRAWYKRRPEVWKASRKRWKALNPDKIKNTHLKYAYGITKKQFDVLLLAQSNSCSICNAEFNSERLPCVDHSHNTNKVRGLLCHKCNMGLGAFSDDPTQLKKAADYLRKHADENPTSECDG